VDAVNLPDLRGRLPIHTGPGYPLGRADGSETVALTPAQVPLHQHALLAADAATTTDPADALLATTVNGSELYTRADTSPATLAAGSVVPVGDGDGQPHDNVMPFRVVNFIIALSGVYPSRT
jgi:microcystin-dependent protein